MGRLGTNWQGALLGGTNVGRMKSFVNAHSRYTCISFLFSCTLKFLEDTTVSEV